MLGSKQVAEFQERINPVLDSSKAKEPLKGKMVEARLGDGIGLNEEVIKKACNLAMKAHLKAPEKPFIFDENCNTADAVFAFSGSWAVNDWYSRNPFGGTKISAAMFPSLLSIGIGERAVVNEAFSCRFEELLQKSQFQKEVGKAVLENKKIVFAGHSSGGPMAILAALWFLEKFTRSLKNYAEPPFCVTFGSPLTGDRIFSHALRRENWAKYFIHFVMRYDIFPRIMLAPLSSIEPGLQLILPYTNPKSPHFKQESIEQSTDAISFFVIVMRNASCVASHSACNLMGCANLMLETVSSFIELSPYRPFGTYIFCSGNGKLVVIDNPDAVFQLLFYSAQLSYETEGQDAGDSFQLEIQNVVRKSLKEHLSYENELEECLEMQNVVYLNNNLVDLPLSPETIRSNEEATLNTALNDLGLSTRARLCLRAAGELEGQKIRNQEKIDSNQESIREGLNKIQEYQTKCEARRVGYYDAFKLQKDINDFNANVKRLELVGIWDEIVEMLKRYELPDGFEGRKEWIELGTWFRRLVEPLDIANYYRHLKNEDTGPYLNTARPRRYRFIQRWLEHAEKMAPGTCLESCFWAEVEELSSMPFGDVEEKVLSLEKLAAKWLSEGKLSKDIFFEESTFDKWWKTLPYRHRLESCISGYMNKC